MTSASEVAAGPWGVAAWQLMSGSTARSMHVAVAARHQETGERKRHAVRVVLGEHRDVDDVAARVLRAQEILRLWIGDLNRAECGDQCT